MEKKCWNCGHYVMAAGCWKDGNIGCEGWRDSGPDDVCNDWTEEGTPGSVSEEILNNVYGEEKDGSSWRDNEYLKD